MSSAIRATNDEELRVRSANAQSVGQLFLGTVANPLNFVLFNSGLGNNAILQKFDISSAVANTVAMFRISANPGLAAGVGIMNRNFGGTTSQMLWQVAVAAQPATIGQIAAASLGANAQISLIEREQYFMSANQGILVTLPALAGNVFVSVAWYEL